MASIIKSVLEAIEEQAEFSVADAKQIVNQVTKAEGVKKGLVMRSLRGALMGELKGPDLMQSWVLLHEKGWDKRRLSGALAQI